ncbi:21334_t:CDS:2, partial [Gigaspora margarita]
NSNKRNYKQFQYQKDTCYINKRKRPSYKIETTGVQKRARNLKVKQDHQIKVNKEAQRTIIKEICKNRINTYICIMGNFNAVDSFCFINPHKKEYTWQKDNSASRINYVWLGEEFQDVIMKAEIKNITEIETSTILNYGKLRKKEGKGPTRRVFLYHKATEENWKFYSKYIDSILKTKKTVNRKLNAKYSKIEIDKEWETIKKVLRKKTDIEECKRRENEISLKIEQRFNMMKKDKKKMLQSLLNKPYNKVTLDRVLVEEKSYYQNQKLVNDEMEVKQQVTAHFQKQFRRKDQKFNEINQE